MSEKEQVVTLAKPEGVFVRLFKINVGDKIEKKNGLSYLSWSFAWAEVKKEYPLATYKVYEQADGCIYWHDAKTAWVKVSVTIEGLEHIEYLPVMDFRNASITLDKINSMDVNKAIQRGLTKAIARHGLGLYVYAGEDLPEEETHKPSAPPPIKEPQRKSAQEPTSAELKALADKKAKEYHKDETPKEGVKVPLQAKQTPLEGALTATGLVSGQKEPNGWGYVVYFLDGFQKDDGKDIPFSTKDTKLIDIIEDRLHDQKVSLTYTITTNAKGYTNYNIIGASLVEKMGDK